MLIACLGGAHLDTKAHLGDVPRLAGSNPATITRSPGGVACNVARNLVRLGAHVVICSLVGDDDAAASLRATLTAEGVDDSGLVTDPALPTAGYFAVLDPTGGLVIGVTDMAIYEAIDVAWVDDAVRRATGADLWVVDANLPEPVLRLLIDRAPVPVLADPVSVPKAERLNPVLNGLTWVFPDRAEAAVLADGFPADHIANAARISSGGAGVVVSLGAEGAYQHGGNGNEARPAIAPDRVTDVTGAGDALVAGFAYALAAGESDPLGWGLAAASLAIETGSSAPEHLSADAIRLRLEI